MQQEKTYRRLLLIIFSIVFNLVFLIIVVISNRAQNIQYDKTVLILIAALMIVPISLAVRRYLKGITISPSSVSKFTNKLETINYSDVKICQYKIYWSYGAWGNYGNGWFVIVLAKTEKAVPDGPEILGVPMDKLQEGLSIPTIGWLPKDRKELFTSLLSALESNNVQIEEKARKKLMKLAGIQ